MIKILFKAINFIKEYGWINFFYRSIENIIDIVNEKNKRYISQEIIQKEEMVLSYMPLISVVVPIYNTPSRFLKEMIESVLNQSYDNLQLCLFDGGSDNSDIDKIIKEYMNKDKRIKYLREAINEGIARNTNKAIKMATGEYIAFLDHDDLLTENALLECIKVINISNPDIIYSDEDKVTSDGKKYLKPHLKPDWSPDTLLSYNYICHFLVVRRCILEKVNYVRDGVDGSQDYDLILRLSNETKSIVHIPKILYHWRINENSTAGNIFNKKYAFDAGKKALEDFLLNTGTKNAIVGKGAFPGSYNIRYSDKFLTNPQVTIICIGSWESETEINKYYSNLVKTNRIKNKYKFFILNKNNIEKSKSINDQYSIISLTTKLQQKINEIVFCSSNEHIILIDQNIEILDSNWIHLLISNAHNSDTVVVAPKLIRKNKIYSYGFAVAKNKLTNIHQGLHRKFYGYFGRAQIAQNITAVAPELLLIKKSFVDSVGGLDLRYNSLLFTIIDLCFQAKRKNKFIKIVPIELGNVRHHKGMEINKKDELEFFEKNNEFLIERDPYFPFIT